MGESKEESIGCKEFRAQQNEGMKRHAYRLDAQENKQGWEDAK